MSCYSFIFARGGSKGLKRKNIRPLAGKPLIGYAIETAKQVKQIQRVFVSTEDSEIIEVAQDFGAEIIERPASIAQDNTPEWLAWQHAVNWVEEHHGIFNEFINLPVTSPLRAPKDVEAAIDKRRTTQSDICISVTPSSRNPYFNMVQLNTYDQAELVIDSKQIRRRQEAPEVYDITTVVYATSPQYIKNNTGIFDGSVVAVKVPKHRAVDIDDIYDFKLAEVLLNESFA